jgi:hypothetical protein
MDGDLRRKLVGWVNKCKGVFAGKQHRDAYRDVCPDQYLRERDAGLTPNPGSSDDRLLRVLVEFAALRRFMLHAPLADLLPKQNRRKLPPTSNAIRH